MIYVAKCYVGSYKPGEVFDADIPERELKRLLKKGAIEQTGATLQEVLAENGIECGDDAGDTVPNNEDAEETCDTELTEETEAPEIDVMDGISGDAPTEEKPKARRGRK